MTVRPEQVGVRLSEREKRALKNFAEAHGLSMGHVFREWTLPEIPPEYWDREEPPPGQLVFDEEEI